MFKRCCLVVCAGVMVPVLACAAEPEPAKARIPVETGSLNTTHQLIGPLGRPVGEVFTVDLTLSEKSHKGYFENQVKVTAIDSKVLKEPVVMPAKIWNWADIKELREGVSYRVRIYQDAGMIGHPWEALKETVSIQTTGHTFACWLVILKSAEPEKK
ncbi:MAG: hypothetical protein QM755_03060 [Luteolibacter sp.]